MFNFDRIDRSILQAMSEGLTNREIAARLNYCPSTIERRLTYSIYPQMNISRLSNGIKRAAAVGIAYRKGILDINGE